MLYYELLKSKLPLCSHNIVIFLNIFFYETAFCCYRRNQVSVGTKTTHFVAFCSNIFTYCTFKFKGSSCCLKVKTPEPAAALTLNPDLG